MKYKVGDKVRIIDAWVDGCCQNNQGRMDKWLGKVMTIKQVERGHYYMVEDQKDRGDYGWAWNDNCIAGLADNHKIVITSDGKETLARLYEGNKVIKSATAKCSPDDTFDFNFGATLAFERLMNEEKKPMTFREKLAKDHPERVNKEYVGGCMSCPHSYGYEKKDPSVCDGTWSETKCTKCWDRVIPEQKVEKKEEPKKEEPKDDAVKVGDVVKVTNPGSRFSTYPAWIEKNAPEFADYYRKGGKLLTGEFGIVRAIAPHHSIPDYGMLYAIECSDHRVFIIEHEGVKKLK